MGVPPVIIQSSSILCSDFSMKKKHPATCGVTMDPPSHGNSCCRGKSPRSTVSQRERSLGDGCACLHGASGGARNGGFTMDLSNRNGDETREKDGTVHFISNLNEFNE